MLIHAREYWAQIRDHLTSEMQSRDEICKRSGRGKGVVSLGLGYARERGFVVEGFVKGRPRYKNLDSSGNQE